MMKAWKQKVILYGVILVLVFLSYGFHLRNATGPQVRKNYLSETRTEAVGLDYFAQYGDSCTLPPCEAELQEEDGK